jgi:DnaJ-class molecular chaperone
LLTIAIHEVVKPGYERTIKGEGMPSSKDPNVKGDLILRFSIEFPNSITSQQKQLLQQAFK